MPLAGTVDPTPFTSTQTRALAAAAVRELSWGLRAASRETRRWRRLAQAIPDARLRADALYSLDSKQGHAHGAALFTILPRRREPQLLRLLVAFETMVDYLDNVNERHPDRADGEQLHHAPIDALDPRRACSDYYRRHPWREDGGYLAALVDACRVGCRALPSFERVRAPLAEATRRGLVLGVNHDPDPGRRDAAMQAWAAAELPDAVGLTWFELGGAASATLSTLVLLALAAEPELRAQEAATVHAAYWPRVQLATTMLDSWVDAEDDARAGHHSYVAHYGDAATALPRVRDAVAQGMAAARGLPSGQRHAVLVGCMVAMYLSQAPDRDPWSRAATRELAAAGGSLVGLLMPALRGWRLACARRPPPMPARE